MVCLFKIPLAHSATASTGSSPKAPNLPLYVANNATALHAVEGFALVMLCQIRQTPRRISISLLKEVKSIFGITNIEVRTMQDPLRMINDEILASRRTNVDRSG